MKNIQRKQKTFQKLSIQIYRLIFGSKPEPVIKYDGFINHDRQLLKQAVLNFELKKRGAR